MGSLGSSTSSRYRPGVGSIASPRRAPPPRRRAPPRRQAARAGPARRSPVAPPRPSFAGAAAPAAPPARRVQLEAQPNPHLEALTGQYKDYLADFKGDTGHFLDVTGQRVRDAREGGRRSLAESEALRGISSSNRAQQYEEGTLDEVSRAVTDAGMQRESTYGNMLQGGVGVYGAGSDLALREKGLGLQALKEGRAAQGQQYDQARQSSLDRFSQFLQMLQLQNRTPNAPAYTGY